MKNTHKLLLSLGLCAALVSPAFGYGWIPGKGEPLPVEESIEAMMRTNHSLRAMQENRSAVGHEVDRAKAGWGPRVDIVARGGFGYLDNSTTRSYEYDSAAPYSSASLLVTQPLWDGFRTLGRVEEAEATYRSLDHRVLDNATSLALDAIIAHVDVLRRADIYKLAKKNVAAHEDILRKARARADRGVDTMADVSQAQSRLARAKSTLSDAEKNLRIGEDTYTRLTKHRLAGVTLAPVPMPAKMYKDADEVLALARTNNPKVAAFTEDVQAARAVKKQVKAAYSPQIDLEMGPSYSDRDGKRELFTSEFGVAAVMRWNIFNSMADVNENAAAAARIRQSRQTLYDFMDSLKLSVQESWAEFVSAQEQLAFYKEAVDFNLSTRDAYQEQFVMGQRSLLDVLDAETELFNSSSQACTASGNAIIAAYRMKALTGELIPSFNIRTDILKVTPSDHEALDKISLPE